MDLIYPAWRYHRTLPARIIQTIEDDQALGPEWADTPAAFDPPSAVAARPVAAAPSSSAPSPAEVEEERARARQLEALDIPDVLTLLAPVDDVAILSRIRAREALNQETPGGRLEVLHAIDAKLLALGPPTPPVDDAPVLDPVKRRGRPRKTVSLQRAPRLSRPVPVTEVG